MAPWRNGSASDSRSEGCVFESRRGQFFSDDQNELRTVPGSIDCQIVTMHARNSVPQLKSAVVRLVLIPPRVTIRKRYFNFDDLRQYARKLPLTKRSP